jgi:uncharacterized protein
MKVKKLPQRMCAGCIEMKPKKELIRIVRNKEGEISIDLIGKKPGRGAYICKNEECLTKAVKTKRLEKNLEVKISDEIYNKLKEEINSAE